MGMPLAELSPANVGWLLVMPPILVSRPPIVHPKRNLGSLVPHRLLQVGATPADSVVGWLVWLWGARCKWPRPRRRPSSLWGAGHLFLEQTMVTLGHGLTPCAREALWAQAQAPSTSHRASGSLCQSTEQPQPLPAAKQGRPLEEGAKKELQKQGQLKVEIRHHLWKSFWKSFFVFKPDFL